MYIYIYMCVYVCVCVYIYTRHSPQSALLSAPICVYSCKFLYVYIYIYMYVCICVYVYVCVYIHIYTTQPCSAPAFCPCLCMFMWICIFMWIRIFMSICISTVNIAHHAALLQGGEDSEDALSFKVISCKRALEIVAFLRKITCNARYPMGYLLCVLCDTCVAWRVWHDPVRWVCAATPSLCCPHSQVIPIAWYRVAKTHRMPQVAGHFSQKSH